MRTTRIILSLAALLIAAIMLAVTLMAPIIVAAGPAILCFIFLFVSWVVWPKRRAS